MGMGQAMQTMQELGDLDQLENLLRNATSPGALAEADMDRVRDLMGDDAARSLQRLAELTKMLQEAGLIEQKEGRLELTPEGPAQDRFQRVARPVRQAGQGQGRPAPDRPPRPGPRAHLRDQAVRVRRSRSTSICTDHPQRAAAQRHRHARAPVTRRLRDRADRAPHPVVDGVDARPVAVDADARQLPAGQEGGDGAALADHLAVPPRLHGHRRVQRDGPHPHGGATPRGVVGLRVRHEHAARLPAGSPAARQADAAPSRSS